MFLSRKSHIDILEYGNDEGHEIHDQHARMKGFPASCIGYSAKENELSVLDVYKRCYNNNPIKTDLTNQINKCAFRNTPEYNVESLYHGDKGTTRTCQFIRDDIVKIFVN